MRRTSAAKNVPPAAPMLPPVAKRPDAVRRRLPDLITWKIVPCTDPDEITHPGLIEGSPSARPSFFPLSYRTSVRSIGTGPERGPFDDNLCAKAGHRNGVTFENPGSREPSGVESEFEATCGEIFPGDDMVKTGFRER